MSGSRNAGGHFSLKWFNGKFSEEMNLAYEDALRMGVHFDTKGSMINTIYDRKKFGVKYLKPKDDWWAFHPDQFLSLKPVDIAGIVSKVQRQKNFSEVLLEDGSVIKAKNTIVCGGSWTDSLLYSSGINPVGVTYLAGSAVSMSGKNIEKILLHQTTPYRQVSVRNWGDNMIRVGETSEYKQEKREQYINKMLECVSHHTQGCSPVKVYTGYRAMMKTPFAGKVSDHIYAATGGGRNGGVMSFWAARQVLGDICGSFSF
tara:strand:- start:274 stop:1050 length:777 start_codon:yes stop_codon:yes gene_type:complete